MKIPKDPAKVADLYYLARQKRLLAEKSAAKLKVEEMTLCNWLIDNVPKSSGGVIGKIASVEPKPKDVPILEDKVKFLKYARKTNQLDLITEAMNTKAVQERWDAGKKVPGVGKHTVIKLSMHKVKSKR